MKFAVKTLLLSVLLTFSASGIAQQAHHQGPGADKKGEKIMQHDMAAMDPAEVTKHLKQKQEHMLMMHDLSNKILGETDPQKKQSLKDQQLELMKAHHMQMMSMHHGKGMGMEHTQ